NVPSDNSTVEQPTDQVSEQGTQNERNALENTQHLPQKENFQRMVDKIPHWSNSILLAHAKIERQATPGKAEAIQQTAANVESTGLTSSEQEPAIETNLEANIKLDASLITGTSGGDNAEDITSDNNSLPVELLSASTQTEQNQTQPAAQVIINEEQTQQGSYQQTISIEPKAPAQESQQITIEGNNTANVNINQPVSEQVPQNDQSPVQQNVETSQLNEVVGSQPPAEQSVSDNKADNSQNQTQQATDSKLSADSLVDKAESEQLHITNVQTSNSTTNTNETNIDAAPQQMFNAVSEQNQNIEPSTSTITEDPDTGILLNTASAKVGQQIQESIQSAFGSDQKQITVTLQPPELGKVTIKFEQQGDNITGQLEVTKAETRSQISQQIPDIIRSLEQDNYKEQSSQDMFAGNQDTLGQQYDSQQQPDAAETSQQLTATDQTYQPDSFEQSQMLEHEDSLDMLV
ncbi:MAG: flagellar hook-length control protein FliK, partial [Planctomycetota bacterium]